MLKIKSLEITRAEGPAHQCGRKINCERFDTLSALVWNSWSGSAPKGGGYDKCDLVVTWEDGRKYKMRIDITFDERVDIGKEFQRNIKFYAGTWTPAHMTEIQHLSFLASLGDCQATHQEIVKNYELSA